MQGRCFVEMESEGDAVVSVLAVCGHVVQLGDSLDDGQAQAGALTGAAAVIVGFVEGFEEVGPLIVCDLGALIGDGELVSISGDGDLAAGWGIVDSVGKEIGDGLF